MKIIIALIAAMFFIAVAYMAPNAFAGGSMQKMDRPMYMAKSQQDVSQWVGKGVRNPAGDDLGTLREFVRDSEGNISFAVLSYGGVMRIGSHEAAIPYSALSYDKEHQYVILDATREQLASAPAFADRQRLADRSFAAEIYRYYGQQPYWTEEQVKPKERTERPGY
jgi:hypothetical protein